MQRLLLVGLVFLVGCQGLVGPFQRTDPGKGLSDPGLTMDEKQARAREQLALPDVSREIGPRTYADNPNYRGP